MKKIFILMLLILITGCSTKNIKPKPENSFKYPTEQKYKDISYQKGFVLPYEYHS